MLSESETGSRLQEARKQRGVSQQEAAKALGLSRAEVRDLESGQRAISMLEITRLAEIYQCSPRFFFSAEEEWGKDDLPSILYRELSDLELTLKRKVALWRLFGLCRAGVAMRGMLGRTIHPELPSYSAPMKSVPSAVGQGKDAARKERLRLGLGNRPIRNAAELICGQGIWTVAAELPDGLSGLFVNHPDIGLAVLVNRKYPRVHRRFFYLRGFAHALFDRSGRTLAVVRQDSQPRKMEIRANAFAAEFLMPQKGIAEQLGKTSKEHPVSHARMGIGPSDYVVPRKSNNRSRPGPQVATRGDVAIAVRHFGVSDEVAARQFRNLYGADTKEEKALVQENEQAGKYAQGPGRSEMLKKPASWEISEREFRSQILSLAIEAYNQEEISGGKLAEIGREFNIDRHEMFELAEKGTNLPTGCKNH